MGAVPGWSVGCWLLWMMLVLLWIPEAAEEEAVAAAVALLLKLEPQHDPA